MGGARMAEGGNFVSDSADGGEAVGAVPGGVVHEERAVGVVAHAVGVHAAHGVPHIVYEYSRSRAPCACTCARAQGRWLHMHACM